MTYPGLKVLFVCSAAKTGKCAPAVREQARSLEEMGVRVAFFGIKSGGLIGYLKGIFRLRRYLQEHPFQIIHAHYGLCGMVASLAGARPLVVSLMGSDVLGSWWLRWLVGLFAAWIWPEVVVKSPEMKSVPGLDKAKVIPNGVDLSLFREIPVEQARSKTGISHGIVVLWPASPGRKVKDYDLALRAMDKLRLTHTDCRLLVIEEVLIDEMPFYYNAADVVLVTSRHEGSPNVVKEALACNVPVVSTRVGDVVRWLGGLRGCCICPPLPVFLAEGMARAIQNNGRCDGRSRVEEISADNITTKLIALYRHQFRGLNEK